MLFGQVLESAWRLRELLTVFPLELVSEMGLKRFFLLFSAMLTLYVIPQYLRSKLMYSRQFVYL